MTSTGTETTDTSASGFAADLTQALYYADDDGYFGSPGIRSISTFEDAMLLTGNDGIVVKLADGREYQLTVVRAS